MSEECGKNVTSVVQESPLLALEMPTGPRQFSDALPAGGS